MSSLIYQKYLEKLSKYSTMQETLYNLALFVATDSWWTRNRRYRSAKIGLYNLYIRTCTKASSPKAEQLRVGVVPRNPESVTSSTVSPILSTRVAFTKDTMM